MNAHSKLRVSITKVCREKADERLGSGSKPYIISYAVEQWRLGNITSRKGGVSFIEMPPNARDRREVIWVTELDESPKKLVLLDIGPRNQGKRDGFVQYVAEVCGRFVGGVIGSMTS